MRVFVPAVHALSVDSLLSIVEVLLYFVGERAVMLTMVMMLFLGVASLLALPSVLSTIPPILDGVVAAALHQTRNFRPLLAVL